MKAISTPKHWTKIRLGKELAGPARRTPCSDFLILGGRSVPSPYVASFRGGVRGTPRRGGPARRLGTRRRRGLVGGAHSLCRGGDLRLVAAHDLPNPARDRPQYFVAMDAIAISVLAGARVVEMAGAPMVDRARGLVAGIYLGRADHLPLVGGDWRVELWVGRCSISRHPCRDALAPVDHARAPGAAARRLNPRWQFARRSTACRPQSRYRACFPTVTAAIIRSRTSDDPPAVSPGSNAMKEWRVPAASARWRRDSAVVVPVLQSTATTSTLGPRSDPRACRTSSPRAGATGRMEPGLRPRLKPVRSTCGNERDAGSLLGLSEQALESIKVQRGRNLTSLQLGPNQLQALINKFLVVRHRSSMHSHNCRGVGLPTAKRS